MAENHYYPFGMSLGGQSWQSPTSLENRYLYNGKELQDNLGLDWYDYGARFYDPQIARWMSVDPLADEAYDWTPYRYAYNNPLKFIDPYGMLEDWYVDNNNNIVYDENIKSQEQLGNKGTYIGESFNGKDQNGNVFIFETDGKVEKSDATVTMIEKAGISTESFLKVESTMISEAKTNEGGEICNIITIGIVANDVFGITAIDDAAIPLVKGIGLIANQLESSAVYNFKNIDTRAGHDWQKREDERGKELERENNKNHKQSVNDAGYNSGKYGGPKGVPPAGKGGIALATSLKVLEIYIRWRNNTNPNWSKPSPKK